MLKEPFFSAWSYLLDRFFCEKTALFYDCLIDDTGKAYDHLPSLDDIHRDEPNPNGWGTGMEDSVLSGGSVMDALVGAYAVSKDAGIKPLIDKIFSGMMRCADAAATQGFIARSVSPVDGISHYSNSSRDQYTHWVYAAVRLWDSPLCDEGQRAQIRRVLRDIACKCERDVTPENDYSLLRDDGKVGLVCTMWGDTVGPHERLRLPMFYVAAYHVTGEAHWREKYLSYRDTALRQSHGYEYETSLCYSVLQMQYSLRLCYDLDDDPVFRQGAWELLHEIAVFGEKKTVEAVCRLDQPALKNGMNFVYKPWRETAWRDLGVFGGKRYLNPDQNDEADNPIFYPLRSVGEAASLAALCPNRRVSDAVVEALCEAAKRVDYAHHHTYAPLLLVCGYCLCLENRLYHPPTVYKDSCPPAYNIPAQAKDL